MPGNRTIALIDMNAFYASCHQAENPTLRNKAVIVGGSPTNKYKGMVIAASYEAKNKGVYTTMSIYEALKKVPDAIVVQRDHPMYSTYSKKIMEFLRLIGPTEVASVDEAYVDITERVNKGTSPKTIAMYIQRTLWEKLHLGCSIGISDTRCSAKMAADVKKPFGYVHFEKLQFCSFFHPQNLSKLHGCGKKTEEKLNKYGIYTIGDLAQKDPVEIKLILGIRGEMLRNNALGIGSDIVNAEREKGDKTIGKEKTFSQPTTDPHELLTIAQNMIDLLCRRLQEKEQRASTISIVYKTERGGGSHSKSLTVSESTSDPTKVFSVVESLYENHLVDIPLWLFGVRLSNFDNANYVQLRLF
ncbi:hypothetical protein BTR23_12375 [Alkalihalophilus pseudofirmus]|nr:hypothetical protein BTR23_12375 [Alkalihalophilus pseudofirmus]